MRKGEKRDAEGKEEEEWEKEKEKEVGRASKEGEEEEDDEQVEKKEEEQGGTRGTGGDGEKNLERENNEKMAKHQNKGDEDMEQGNWREKIINKIEKHQEEEKHGEEEDGTSQDHRPSSGKGIKTSRASTPERPRPLLIKYRNPKCEFISLSSNWSGIGWETASSRRASHLDSSNRFSLVRVWVRMCVRACACEEH